MLFVLQLNAPDILKVFPVVFDLKWVVDSINLHIMQPFWHGLDPFSVVSVDRSDFTSV